MPETNQNTTGTTENMGTTRDFWDDLAGIPTTPIAPPGGPPGDAVEDTPTTLPSYPVPPEENNRPNRPDRPGNGTVWPDYPLVPLPTPGLPSVTYYGQVRFLNATTNGMNIDVIIDGQNVFSGSTFASVSTYIQISDGFHTVTVRRTNGPILYQQTLAFVSGERVTMVILDQNGGVTLSKVSDMGCTNVPNGYGCLRVANMSYNGSNYDIRLFNNQIAFAGVGYKEVTSLKQASAGNYTFFVTNAQYNISTFNELPQLVFAVITGTTCANCVVNNPLLTYSINVQAGKTYTSYIIGNPWSNMYQVYTIED